MDAKQKQKFESIEAVKDFSNNIKSEFMVDVLVYENGKEKYHYSNIGFKQSYEASFGQYTVNIVWEYDTTQSDDYKTRNLHGTYNTNYQKMKYKDGMLIIENGNILLYVIKRQ